MTTPIKGWCAEVKYPWNYRPFLWWFSFARTRAESIKRYEESGAERGEHVKFVRVTMTKDAAK